MSLTDNRLTAVFAKLAADGKKTVLPFLTAGYPDLATTEALLNDFERRGACVCELGVPFSDPIADGPTIQASYTAALDDGVTTTGIFDMVQRYRAGGGQMALLAMVSYSIVFHHEPARFLALAKAAGFDGVIIPDLPVDESAEMEQLAADAGVCSVLLIAPTTPEARRLEIARHSQGFIYYISVSGITGERRELPPETITGVAELRTHTDTPVCVGFGISDAKTVQEVCQAADGAIVGSAIIHRITDAIGADDLVDRVGSFVGELLVPVTQA